MIKSFLLTGRVLVMCWMMSGVTICSAQTYAIELPLSGKSLLLMQMADDARGQGKHYEALELIREALRLRPDSRRLTKLMSRIQKEKGTPGVKSRGQVPSLVGSSAAKSRQADALGKALEQKSSQSAQSVYDLIKNGDLAAAVVLAEKARQKFPDDQAVAAAHVNALVADSRHLEADSAVAQMISRFGMDDKLLVLREGVRQQLALNATYLVYRSLEKKDFDSAIRAANDSILYAPDVMENRLLLIHIQLNAGRYEKAQQAASEAVAIDREDVLPLMMRAYAWQYTGQRAAAITNFEQVLTQFDLTLAEQRNYRLMMADAALAALEPEVALNLLKPLVQAATDPASNTVIWRRRAAMEQLLVKRAGEEPPPLVLEPLNLVCRTSPYGRECNLQPAVLVEDPAYSNASAAFLAMASKDYLAALKRARRAVQLDPDNLNYQELLVDALVLNGDLDDADRVSSDALNLPNRSASMLARRGEVRLKLGQPEMAKIDFSEALKMESLPLAQSLQLLVKLNRKAQAKERLDKALKSGVKLVGSDLDLAYLAIGVGDDARALDAFKRSDAVGLLTTSALQDAAYTAARSGLDPQAITYLSRAVDDLSDNPPLELKDSVAIESLLNIRRLIADLSREWGFNASASYRGAMPASGQLQAGAASNQSVQIGSELFWRPLGNRNGRLLEVYARAFGTPTSSAGGLTGRESLQGSLGIRWKPFSEASLILALGRLFPVASKVESDWLAQIAYSGGEGGELKRETSWWTHQYYAEAGRYLQQRQTYVSGNARWGRSLRLEGINQDLVVFPHAVIAGDYNSDYVQRSAVGVGLGVQFRYWYRQDTYNAHRSYLDFLLQYRVKVQGDESRAAGTFLNLQTSY
jgi:Tfp pilus assembly protein PilF